jgi:hypothetical protein
LDCIEVVLEFQGSCGWVTVRFENCCVISKGCCGCCRGGWKVRGVYEIEEWPKNTALWNTLRGLVMRNAGHCRILRNACLAERIGEGGSN